MPDGPKAGQEQLAQVIMPAVQSQRLAFAPLRGVSKGQRRRMQCCRGPPEGCVGRTVVDQATGEVVKRKGCLLTIGNRLAVLTHIADALASVADSPNKGRLK
jgi:hypothetical protein